MKLDQIIQDIQSDKSIDLLIEEYGMSPKNIDIMGLAENSKYIQQDSLFAAFPGYENDGRKYIEEAIIKGASVVLTTLDFNSQDILKNYPHICVLKTECPRQVFSFISVKFYNSLPHHIVAVTGTNGKTSTVRFSQQLWECLGIEAASLGTLGLNTNIQNKNKNNPASLTTPDVGQLHRQLMGIKKTNIDHIALEASSHGLSQFRLDGLHICAAAFTNLTHDHLDYHGTIENYFDAKKRLFEILLSAQGTAILNADSTYFSKLAIVCEKRGISVLSYGIKGKDLVIKKTTSHMNGIECHLAIFGKDTKLLFPLIGHFQLMNALAAFGLVYASMPPSQCDLQKLIEGLSKLKPVRGRLEKAASLHNGARIYVDYAHTPDALKSALLALRSHCKGKLHVLFGCGGNRDQEKRPLMGEIAEEFSNHIIITDDNPRYEDPAKIRSDILQGCKKAIEIPDRKKAIWQSLSFLDSEDILLVAGKGHEPGQIIGNVTHPFDDANEIKKAVKDLSEIDSFNDR